MRRNLKNLHRKKCAGKHPVDRLLEIVSTLRGTDGCPWDKAQTLSSLKHCLVEETYEVIDAIDSDDRNLHEEELGDILLLIVLQTRIRSEAGDFDFNDVVERLCDKLIRRHPHVFGSVKVSRADEALRAWEGVKAHEKKAERLSAVDGVPRSLPVLERAIKIQSKASRAGFDWTDVSGVVSKVEEELSEVRRVMARGSQERLHDELGDLLFAVTNLCRFLDVRAEEALERTNAKFMRRFREVERMLAEKGKKPADSSLAEMDRLWRRVKRGEKRVKKL